MEGLFELLFLFMISIFFIKKIGDFNLVEHHTPVISRESLGYRKKFSIMNKTESALFFELKKQLPNYYIFPNMRIADVIDAINGYGFYQRRNKILLRHIDFIICNSHFKPIFAVELNGGYHKRIEQIVKDNEKIEILREAKLPLKIVEVGDNFTEKVFEIKNNLI
jgi:hypothetical protein